MQNIGIETGRAPAVHTISVSLVTTDPQGRVLLIRTTKVGWELPGGRVAPGEDLLEAAPTTRSRPALL